jgi:hypothetical protein
VVGESEAARRATEGVEVTLPRAAWRKDSRRSSDTGENPYFNDVGPGWMVAIDIDGIECFISLKFAREIDAEIAAESIRDVINWSGTKGEIAKRLKEYGVRNLRKRMTENLLW